jgi:hypothetical protein
MDPSANITAVWLGVMIGLNIQTSFLTPPFGFALFYLRGVAAKIVKTVEIYKGVIPFIGLQLVGLAFVGYLPSLVNYLPARMYLTSEASPPPMNPKLQDCLEDYVFNQYLTEENELVAAASRLEGIRSDYLPDNVSKKLNLVASNIRATFLLVEDVKNAHAAKAEVEAEYRPLHKRVRFVQNQIRRLDRNIDKIEQTLGRIERGEASEVSVGDLNSKVDKWVAEKIVLESEIPAIWEERNAAYLKLLKDDKTKVNAYRRNVDDAYMALVETQKLINSTPEFKEFGPQLESMYQDLPTLSPDIAMQQLKNLRSALGSVDGTSKIKSRVNKSRKALRGDNPNIEKALSEMGKAIALFRVEVEWREKAFADLASPLAEIDAVVSKTIGLRQQAKLTKEQALFVASCTADHKDVSLNF